MPSIPKPPLPKSSHDLKLDACLDYANKNWATPKIKTDELKIVTAAFRHNVARVRFMMLVPAMVANTALTMQRCIDLAEFEIMGALVDGDVARTKAQEISERFVEIFNEQTEHDRQFVGTPEWDRFATVSLKRGSDPVNLLAATPPTTGFDAMLSAYIAGAWTAIEGMAGDLWEAAINAHPDALAELNGTSNRLRQTNKNPGGAPKPTRKDQDDLRSVPLKILRSHKFNIREKMGTILRERYRYQFSSLEGIREAYASAFDKDTARIDGALSDKALDSLNAVRNVVVHKSGRADPDYVKKSAYLKIPKTAIDTPILLDGETVVGLIVPALSAATKLLAAVDDWIVKHKP